MLPRNVIIKLEKLLSFDGIIGYLILRAIESITKTKSTRDLNDLSNWLEWPHVALEKWVFGIPNGYYYESFYIPKKGGRGKRKIDAPNQELKVLQQRIYHKLLKRLNQHQAATGYIPKKSIVDNALPHVRQDTVINIDLKDFFSNISSNRVYNCWRFLGWDIKAAMALTHICCYQKHLPQGAPTSPALSNICNIMLDTRLDALAKSGDGCYTRYADDLTFSFPIYSDREKRILKTVFQVISAEDYEVQKKKRVRIQRSHQRQTTTGLIVNQKVNLPRTMRRKIRSMQHHLANKTISPKDLNRLKGYEGLLKMVNKANDVVKSNTNKVSTPFLETPFPDTAQVYLAEEKEIYISYAWGGESEKIVNELDQAFQNRGVTIVRDKRNLGFKGRIKGFMETIGRGKAVVLVISEKYLKSENCLFELLQVAKYSDFEGRIFPVVLDDAKIYKAIDRIRYVQHWEQQLKELDDAMKTVSAANMQGFREDIDLYAEIRANLSRLTDILKDMNTLTPSIHRDADFQTLFDAVMAKLEE